MADIAAALTEIGYDGYLSAGSFGLQPDEGPSKPYKR